MNATQTGKATKPSVLKLDSHGRYLTAGACEDGDITIAVSDAGSNSGWIRLAPDMAAQLLQWLAAHAEPPNPAATA